MQDNSQISPQVLSIGDCLILMNPTKNGSLRYVRNFEKEWAGAEANFLVGCSRLGLDCGFISAFSTDPFGKMIYHDLKGEGVDLSQAQWDEKRATPLFFKERRARGNFAVYYYRKNKAGSFIDFQKINSDYFSQTKLFFFTSIFPALSEQNKEFLQKILKIAKTKGAKICFDPNIRLKLFQDSAQVKKLILPFLEQVDLLLISHNEAELLFGSEQAEQVFQQAKKYGISNVVLKKGENGSVGWNGKEVCTQPAIPVEVVDTCGAGDAFNVGFLYGYVKHLSLAESMELAAHSASFAVNSYSDNENAPSLEELYRQKNQEKSIDR